MFNEATFREILLPSSGNVNDYVAHIFTYIKTHYGETILAKIRKLEKTKIKYSSYTNHLRFSLRCHHNKILPKDLQLKSRIKTERSKIILQPLVNYCCKSGYISIMLYVIGSRMASNS